MTVYQHRIRTTCLSLMIAWIIIRTRAGDMLTSECLSGRIDCKTGVPFYCKAERGPQLCESIRFYCSDDNLCHNGTHQECVCTSNKAFNCGNGRCVDNRLVCDRQNDCENGMDEQNCSIACSDVNSFDCKDGSCIPYHLICDGISHCPNGFDEEGCDMEVMNACTSEKYRRCNGQLQERRIDQKSCFALVDSNDCKQRKGQLITINSKRKQDMVVEYLDTNYALWLYSKYQYHGFKIGLGKKIGNSTHADFMWADGSPLAYTQWISTQNTNEKCFALGISAEREVAWLGDKDCDINDDEFLCQWTSHTHTGIISVVPEGNITSANRWDLFQCDSGELIKVVYVCNKIRDCKDGSDEDKCDELWLTGLYHCDDGTRLNIGQWCDFSYDCEDRSDEIYCVVTPCNNYQWKCDSGQCVPLSAVCDNKFDCFDQSDEGTCYGKCLERDLFSCSDREFKKCIPRSLATDDVYDCPDLEDIPVTTFPACPPNKTGTFFVDVGSDEHGPIAVNCIDTKLEIKSTSIERKFDSVQNLTILSLRYGSDDVVDILLTLYETCIQLIRGPIYRWEHRFTNERPVIGHDMHFASNDSVAVMCGFKDCLYTSNLPLRTVVFENLDLQEDDLKPVLTCIGPIPEKHDELFALETMACKTTGTRIYARNKCLLNIKPDGSPFGCRDLTHLEDCEEFHCPEDFVKCPNSFCLHVRLACDGQQHCPHGEDERNCANYTCKGMYSCRQRPGCLPDRLLCDGISHCPLGDDEELCDFICPHQCTCESVALKCKTEIEHKIIIKMASYVRNLDLSNILLSENGYCVLSRFRMLIVLNISGCGLNLLTSNLCDNPLMHLNNLRSLDLSNNKLKNIQSDMILGLYNLRKLFLDGNVDLTVIEPYAFNALTRVTHVHISSTSIKHLDKHVFTGLTKLKFLDLSFNGLAIDFGTFEEVPLLEYLDVRGNTLPIAQAVFDGITSLQVLYTDSPTLCCLMKAMFYGATCVAPESYISSCDNLIENELLRISIWIIGGTALLGNTFVIVYRIVSDLRGKLKTHSILVTSLGLSDFLMGVYTLLIAAVDVTYRGEYITHDLEWRTSPLCTFAGIISTLSSELSALLICIIAVDRYIAIKYPFTRMSVKVSVILVIVAAIVSLLVAIIPVLSISYFEGGFYSRSAVCVALPLTNERTPGWEYSVGIFIVFNLVIFIVVGIVQVMLYREVKSTSAKAKATQAKVDAALAKSLTTVIMTDFCCWFPIGVMGFMSLAGYQISSDVYAWVIVFVLPINSALNPFLYTISAVKRNKRYTVESQNTDAILSANEILQIHQRITHQGLFGSTERNTDCIPLSQFLADHTITIDNIEMIKERLEDDLEFFHNKDFYHGHISEDTVYIKMTTNEMVDALLEFEHKRITKHMNKHNDTNSLAELIRRLRNIASLSVTSKSVENTKM